MLKKFANVAWFLTFLGFFAALTLGYAFMPEDVGVQSNAIGDANSFVDKEVFFYAGLAIFSVVNLLFFFLLRMLNGVPASSGIFFRNRLFKKNITGWFAGFVTIINLFLIIAATYIALFNNQGSYQIGDFSFIVYIAPLLFIASMVWLAAIFMKRHQQLPEME